MVNNKTQVRCESWFQDKIVIRTLKTNRQTKTHTHTSYELQPYILLFVQVSYIIGKVKEDG